MNEESTRELPDKRSFEERVFARFDAMETRFDAMETRFDAMETRFDSVELRLERLESRSYDTKPIWEQALTAITETRREVGEIKSKVDVIDGKVQSLEDDVRIIKAEQRTMRVDLLNGQRDLRHHIDQNIDSVLKLLVADRENVRDAQIRIRQLESKLA
jgi:chromosome segregation ATPase